MGLLGVFGVIIVALGLLAFCSSDSSKEFIMSTSMILFGVMLIFIMFNVDDISTKNLYSNEKYHEKTTFMIIGLSEDKIEGEHESFSKKFKPHSSDNLKLGDLVEVVYYKSSLDTKYIYSINVLEIKK
jgi:hypothetical protein